MSTPDPSIKQLQAEFEQAARKLSRLKEQVQKMTRLADAKGDSDRLSDDRERATHALGAAVWTLVKRGEVQLPASCAKELAALEEVERMEKAHAIDIAAVLQEGSEVADRLNRGKK